MGDVATAGSRAGRRLSADAGLAEVIEAVNDLSANVARRERLSPSVPLDGEHPSASIVYSDEAYDAFVERLDSDPAPNERLRRTMAGADDDHRVSKDITVAALKAPPPRFRSGREELDRWRLVCDSFRVSAGLAGGA
jgi:hypothetical protein